MKDLEQARKEKLARNELMLRQLMGAAEDLATTVEPDRQAQEENASKNKKDSKAYKKRLAEEALQVGRRKLSSRAATAAAKKKIASTFSEAVPLEHVPTGSDDSADFEQASEGESEENSDPSAVDSGEECEDVPPVKNRAKSNNGSNKGAAADDDAENGDDGSELQVALAMSMQYDCDQEQAKKPPPQAKSQDTKAAPSEQAKSKEFEATVAVENISQLGKKRNRGLDLAQKDVSEIFDFIADGKVTLGVSEFVGVVNRLGLDIDDSTVEAAFECLQQSPFSGPCNRVDKPAFQAFVQYLRDL